MTLKEIVFIETFSILTEEKVNSFVNSLISRYNEGKYKCASRIEAINQSKNPVDRQLYRDEPFEQVSKREFRRLCIIRFNEVVKFKKTKMTEHEFIRTMDSYLSNFSEDGKFIPLKTK